MTFFERSLAIAERFLETAVVVDDQATLEERTTPVPDVVITPGRAVEPAEPTPLDIVARDNSHDLNAKELIDSFAKHGIMCGVLKPTQAEDADLPVSVQRLAARSDIVILDWQLNSVEGETTLELIEAILSHEDSENRLRLIAVYTAQPRLADIADRVFEKLSKRSPSRVTGAMHTVQAGAARIVILAKQPGSVRQQDIECVVPVAGLPARLVSEFTKMTSGLLSNVALSALSAIRADTYRLLERFPRSLDAAFLTHRALLYVPTDSEDHVVPLVVSEIQSLLDDRRISDCVAPSEIEMWIDDQRLDFKKMADDFGTTPVEVETTLRNFLVSGTGQGAPANRAPRFARLIKAATGGSPTAAIDQITSILSSTESAHRLNCEFSWLMSLRTRYVNPAPALTMGTIVEEVTDEPHSFWLCVQPVCDSVRLPFGTERRFPFLRLAKKDGPVDFELALESVSGMVYLKLQNKLYEGIMVTFTPRDGSDAVVASKLGSEWRFTSEDPKTIDGVAMPRVFRWVADLKTDQAQRVAHTHGQQQSWVGLTESEWQRRSAR